MWLPSLSDQFPCESAVLLPGCGLAPFDTSLPGLPLLSPGTPLTRSGAMGYSSIVNAFLSLPLLVRGLDGPSALVRAADAVSPHQARPHVTRARALLRISIETSLKPGERFPKPVRSPNFGGKKPL